MPPGEVKIVKYIFLKRAIINVAVLIVGAQLILIFALLGTQLFLSRQYNKEKEAAKIQNNNSETEEIKKSEQKINDFNNYLIRLRGLQESHIDWTQIIDVIIKNKPQEVKLTSLVVKDETKKISILGTTPTRDTFLQFKDNLEKSNYFYDFNSPLSNIINPTNINFSLEFSVK